MGFGLLAARADRTVDRAGAAAAAAPPILLLDSARLSLAPDIEPVPGGLEDAVAGGRYLLNAVGEHIAQQVDGRATFGAIVADVAERFAIPDVVAGVDVKTFIEQLHAHRLVSIHQSFAREARLRARRFLLSLLLLVWLRAWPSPPSPPSRRYPATPGWILRGAIEAHLATLAGGAVLAILAAGLFAVRNLGLGLPAFSSATPYIVAVMLGYGVGLLASALVHELAHYWAARRCGIRMRAVFVRMCVVGLSHESGPPLPTLLVSAAGPLAALVLMGGLCLLILNLPIGPLSERLPVAFACLTIAVQHLPGLTPLTRDGRLIAGAIGKLFLAAASRG